MLCKFVLCIFVILSLLVSLVDSPLAIIIATPLINLNPLGHNVQSAVLLVVQRCCVRCVSCTFVTRVLFMVLAQEGRVRCAVVVQAAAGSRFRCRSDLSQFWSMSMRVRHHFGMGTRTK